MTSRRSFLQTLGIAAAGLAFRPAAKFSGLLVPDDLIRYDGPASIEWILADAIALLAAELPAEQFRHVPATPLTTRVFSASHCQFGISFDYDESFLERSRQEIRENWLAPAMAQFANEMRFRKVSACFALPIPQAVEQAARIYAPKAGLDLRFIRAYDIGRPGGTYTEEDTGLVVEYGPTLPGWRARFDMAAA